MMKTMTVVIPVSRRLGQVTLATSARTCWKNANGLVLAAMNSVPDPALRRISLVTPRAPQLAFAPTKIRTASKLRADKPNHRLAAQRVRRALHITRGRPAQELFGRNPPALAAPG
jgi:hypothetical protein